MIEATRSIVVRDRTRPRDGEDGHEKERSQLSCGLSWVWDSGTQLRLDEAKTTWEERALAFGDGQGLVRRRRSGPQKTGLARLLN